MSSPQTALAAIRQIVQKHVRGDAVERATREVIASALNSHGGRVWPIELDVFEDRLVIHTDGANSCFWRHEFTFPYLLSEVASDFQRIMFGPCAAGSP
jgi:hypothetical protein